MIKIDFNSIRSRLVFWFLILTLIPLSTVMLITYIQEVKVIEQSAFDKLIAIRDLKVERLKDWLSERESDLTTIAADKELLDLEHIISKKSYDTEDESILSNVNQTLKRYHKNYSAYHDIFIINPINAQIIASTDQTLEWYIQDSIDYFNKTIESRQLEFTDVHFSKHLGHNTIAYSIPIFSNNLEAKHIVGILVAYIDLENSLYDMLLERVGLGKTGETLIVNKDGLALNELRWNDDAPLNLKITAKPAVKAASGETGIAITTDYRDEKILAAYTYIKKTDWGFVCKQDMHELNAPIRHLLRYYLIAFIISALIIIVISFILSRSISRPIIEINKVTQKIATGDLSSRSNKKYRGELGSLSIEINKMAEMTEDRIFVQNGISDISKSMIGKSSMLDFANSLINEMKTICKAELIAFRIYNEAIDNYDLLTSIGISTDFVEVQKSQKFQDGFKIVQSQPSVQHFSIVPEIIGSAVSKEYGKKPVDLIFIPIVIDSVLVATITLGSFNGLKKHSFEICKQSWPIINTAYSNLLSSERTRIFAEQLTSINQELETKSEELQEQSEELQSQSEELKQSSEVLQEQNLELEAQRNQVESANKMKSEFLANMSHELRTPLNSILALSDVLIQQAKNKLSDEENDYLEIVARNGKRLLAMINDILDISKIEAGKMDVIPEPISIKSLVSVVKDNIQSLAQHKNLVVNLTIQDDLEKIETDENKLYQVLLNIVSNAIKFTEKGHVDIKVKQDAENTSIEVKDTGIGISKEVLPHIFDEFRQADGSSSRQYEGTGLGLAIANKLMNILGGKIKVESDVGKGSVFTLSIPIKWHEAFVFEPQISLKNIPLLSINADKNDSELLTNSTAENKIRLLYVEDNEDAIIQVKSELEKEGYIVDIALNGKEALDYMQHTIPDGIILDLMMPEIDGFEVLENMRANDKTKMIPVLVLTAKDLSKDDLARLSSNNVRQLIIKGDVDIDGLLYRVKLMLGVDSRQRKETKKGKSKSGDELQTILIIEDNPDNMTTIKALIGDNFKIIEAYDGLLGLNKAKAELPNMILLDMSLPKMNGEEVVINLKKDEKTSQIPIIAVTSQAMKGDKERILALGCDGYVSKPIDSNEFHNEIGRLLNK